MSNFYCNTVANTTSTLDQVPTVAELRDLVHTAVTPNQRAIAESMLWRRAEQDGEALNEVLWAIAAQWDEVVTSIGGPLNTSTYHRQLVVLHNLLTSAGVTTPVPVSERVRAISQIEIEMAEEAEAKEVPWYEPGVAKPHLLEPASCGLELQVVLHHELRAFDDAALELMGDTGQAHPDLHTLHLQSKKDILQILIEANCRTKGVMASLSPLRNVLAPEIDWAGGLKP